MFVDGLIKVANVWNAFKSVGRAMGGRSAQTRAAVKGVAQAPGKAAKAFGGGFSEGALQATRQMKGRKPATPQAIDRLRKQQAIQAKNKPSFAQKHPYLTAGGAFLAGSYAMGGGKEEQPAQPQITYGNY